MNPCKKTIGWADFTWNPVTGCMRDCKYCYARRIHNRFYLNPFNQEEKIYWKSNIKKYL
jgi:DNA repair photolyase